MGGKAAAAPPPAGRAKLKTRFKRPAVALRPGHLTRRPRAPDTPPAAAARKAPAPSAAARKRGRVARTHRTEDGETLSAGEDWYIALDSFDWDAHLDEGDEACEVCGRSQLLTGMLECGCCLRGFHLRCLRPALKKVPEGEWLCPQVRVRALPRGCPRGLACPGSGRWGRASPVQLARRLQTRLPPAHQPSRPPRADPRPPPPRPPRKCDAGEAAPRPQKLATHWQRLLYGEDVVGLVHLLGFTERPLEGELA